MSMLVTGICVGFMVGLIVTASMAAKTDKLRIQNGMMERNGVVYRITRVDP